MNRFDGTLLSGWDHLAQSLGVIITTAVGSRIMRRGFGSGLPRRVDAPISPVTLIDFYADTVGAIRKFEPRFKVTRMRVDTAPDGHLSMNAAGIYYPRGHLGDFSISQPKDVSVPL